MTIIAMDEISEPELTHDLRFRDPEQGKYYCGRCEGWYLSEETLLEHTNLYHEYWCVICKLQIKSERELKQHMNRHCLDKRCKNCRLIFKNPGSALKHMLNKHIEIKDKFASSSAVQQRPASSLHVRSPGTINRRATPVTLPRDSTSNVAVTTNGPYHTILKNRSKYLCAQCNLTFTDIKITAQHCMRFHKVEIGIRTHKDTGKEEIFIIGNKGKIMEMRSATQNHSNASQGSTTLTIATETSTPLSSTESIIPLRDLSRLNRVTLINSATASPVQNGFVPIYASTAQLPVNNSKSKPRPKNLKQCQYCKKELSSNYCLKRHIRVMFFCFMKFILDSKLFF